LKILTHVYKIKPFVARCVHRMGHEVWTLCGTISLRVYDQTRWVSITRKAATLQAKQQVLARSKILPHKWNGR